MNAARDAFADPTPWRRTSRYLDAITAALELNADASFLSVLRIARIARVTRIFKIEVPGTPTVMRVMAACEQLDAFAAADPRRQVGAPQA